MYSHELVKLVQCYNQTLIILLSDPKFIHYFIIKEFKVLNNNLLNDWSIYSGLNKVLDKNLDLDQYWKEKSQYLPYLSKIALFYIQYMITYFWC